MSTIHNNSNERNTMPPSGHDWGERTLQSQDRAPGYWKSDAYEMRMKYGIPELDEEKFAAKNPRRMVYPNLLIHETNPTRSTSPPGGETAVVRGKRGYGKSTWMREAEIRILAENSEVVDGEVQGEIVVHRGSPQRSEWLPLRYWATVWLPENAEISATWMVDSDAREGAEPIEEIPVDELEERTSIRSVRRYSDVYDLLDQLRQHARGTYHVVYPDPSFAGCEEATRRTNHGQFAGGLSFTPAWEADEETDPTPLAHWWFGFLPALDDTNKYPGWMTITFDEMGDLMPERASQANHNLYDKVTLTRSFLAESRRDKTSFIGAIHKTKNVHHEILEELYRWIWMPDGKPLPTENGSKRHYPPGIDGVKQKHDFLASNNAGVGTGACFTEEGFTAFSWGDISDPTVADRYLRIDLKEPDRITVSSSTIEESEPELQFDEAIFGEWQNQTAHRLYVKDPGEGYLDAERGIVVEELVSPLADEELVFPEQPVRLVDGFREVVLEDRSSREDTPVEDVENTIIVARIPTKRSDGASTGRQVGVGP